MLGIWGAVGYTIWSGLSPDTPIATPQDYSVDFTPTATVEIDTFSIQPIARDPFLGTLTSNTASKKSSTQTKKNRRDLYPNSIPWPYC